jgi:hypothetical protein
VGAEMAGGPQFVGGPMFRRTSSLFYRTLADEAHPFNSIQEEAPC